MIKVQTIRLENLVGISTLDDNLVPETTLSIGIFARFNPAYL
jgi:hypothetical protein